MSSRPNAKDLIVSLGLQPHPEGGYFKETFRDSAARNGRSRSTAILYLLEQGGRSHWHRVDAVEIWHFYAGDPLCLSLSADGQEHRKFILGPDVLSDQSPQVVVPEGHWQAARPMGAWTLVGCTVAPGFEFAGFELAPPGWNPSSRN